MLSICLKLLKALCLISLCLTLATCSKSPPLEPELTSGQPFMLFVGLQSIPESIPPGGSAFVTALVLDQNSRPVQGEVIQFSANSGVVSPASSVTDSAGIARTLFTASQQATSAVVTGLHGSESRTVGIAVKDVGGGAVSIESSATDLLANGASTALISTRWLAEDGSALGRVPIAFTTSAGTISGNALTDSSGFATAILTSSAARTDAIAQVSATANETEATVQVFLKGVDFSLTVSPGTLVADGTSSAIVRVVLKERTSTIAISNAELAFGADLGTIPNSASTDGSGVAQVALQSSTESGTSTVTAHYGTLSDTATVNFGPSVPTSLSVSASPSVILADNQSISRITAVVSDQFNNPVSDGLPVTFEIPSGSGTIDRNQSTTAGVAQSTLTSGGRPDTVQVLVRAGQLSDTVTVVYARGAVSSVVLSSDSSSIAADGKTSARITALVRDSAGNLVLDGTKVDFATTIGDITPSAQTADGVAVAQFTSNQTGTAVITATVNEITASVSVDLRPGAPNSVLLTIDPNNLGVKDSGRNQTVNVLANVVDSKNNPVVDGVYVVFSIFSSPGGGETLSSVLPVPTLNGQAAVSLNSGTRSGSVRIMAQVTDSLANPLQPEVRAISTEIIVFAGPPFIEDVNDRSTSHLTVGSKVLNIFGWNVVNNTVRIVAVVGDKFNNPVPPGTAVFFTTTGGIVSTHTGFTDEEGVVRVTLHSAQPYPNITRYYNTYFDPNENHTEFSLPTNVIPGPIPDYEGGQVVNSVGGTAENDGITRVLAVTEGIGANGGSARVWAVTNVVFSGLIDVFTVATSDTGLSPGQSALITFDVYDENGNPIVPGSSIAARSGAGELSWSSITTADPGQTRYQVMLTNNIDPNDSEAKEANTPVTIQITSRNGNVVNSSPSIHLRLN